MIYHKTHSIPIFSIQSKRGKKPYFSVRLIKFTDIRELKWIRNTKIKKNKDQKKNYLHAKISAS